MFYCSCFIGRFEVLTGALLAPVLALVAFNIVIFVIVLTVLIKHSRKKIKRAQANADGSSKQATIRLLISIFSIMNMYGLTWIFGIFTFTRGTFAFQLLFAVFNSLQGFFIFLFFCVLGKEAREAWAKVLCRGKLKKFAPTTSSSRPAVHVSSSAQANTARRYSAQTTATLLRSTDIGGTQSRRSSYSTDTLRSLSSPRHDVGKEPSSTSICEEPDSAVPDIIEFNRQAIATDTLERSRPSLAVAPMLTVHEEDESEEQPEQISNYVVGGPGGLYSHDALGAQLKAPGGEHDSASVSGASLAESGIMIDDETNSPIYSPLPPGPPEERLQEMQASRSMADGTDADLEQSYHVDDQDIEDSAEVVQNPHVH